MQATIPQLKKKINSLADQYGYAFDAKSPYYVNAGRIKAIEEAIVTVKEDGDNNPNLRYEITPVQLKKLNTWVSDLKAKYL